jgi:ribosome-binding factor A
MSRRLERLNEQMRRDISEILRNEVKDPRVGLITVTEARVSSDLSYARLYVRALDGNEEGMLEGLKAATPYIRRELGKRLSIRHIPELRFEADRALENALHIEKLLSEVRVPDEDPSDADGDEEITGDETADDESDKDDA